MRRCCGRAFRFCGIGNDARFHACPVKVCLPEIRGQPAWMIEEEEKYLLAAGTAKVQRLAHENLTELQPAQGEPAEIAGSRGRLRLRA